MNTVSSQVNPKISYQAKRVPKRERRSLLSTYKSTTGRGLTMVVADAVDRDPSAVVKVFHGKWTSALIHGAIEDELGKIPLELLQAASPSLMKLQQATAEACNGKGTGQSAC